MWGFVFVFFKDFIASKSLTRREAHNVIHVVCTSHLVILLKHLMRGRNLLRLNVSRCAQFSLSTARCFFSSPARELSVSIRPRATQASFFLFLAPYTANTKTKISLPCLNALVLFSNTPLPPLPSFYLLSLPASVIVYMD